jgi:hypothetical protein
MYHSSYLSTQAKERTIQKFQTSGAPLPLRRLLEIDRDAARNKVENARRTQSPGMLERGLSQLLDLEEQLALMDAIDLKYITPILNETPVTEILSQWKEQTVDYPAELFTATRAEFVTRIKSRPCSSRDGGL